MYDMIYACINNSNRCSQATPAKKKDKKNVYLMFPCCHSNPEAFHLSFILKGGGWHGLIIQKLLTQVVMLLWPMVWEESYRLLSYRYIVINQQQFIHMFEENPYKNNSGAV